MTCETSDSAKSFRTELKIASLDDLEEGAYQCQLRYKADDQQMITETSFVIADKGKKTLLVLYSHVSMEICTQFSISDSYFLHVVVGRYIHG